MKTADCHIKKQGTDKTKRKRLKTQGFVALIGSALAFSLMTVCIKQLQGSIQVSELVFFRSIFSLFVTGCLIKKEGISPWGKNHIVLLIRGLMGTGALYCIFKAIDSLPLAAATIIQYSYPIFTTIFAWLLLQEKIRRRTLLSIAIGWVGIQLVVQPFWGTYTNDPLPIKAVSIALLGAILTALAYISVRKLSKEENSLVIIFYFPLVSIPISLALLTNQWTNPQGIEWIWIVGIGICTQIGQILITKGLKILPAGYASSINYTQVIFASLWGLLIFSEQISVSILIGGACVLGATLISLSGLSDF